MTYIMLKVIWKDSRCLGTCSVSFLQRFSFYMKNMTFPSSYIYFSLFIKKQTFRCHLYTANLSSSELSVFSTNVFILGAEVYFVWIISSTRQLYNTQISLKRKLRNIRLMVVYMCFICQIWFWLHIVWSSAAEIGLAKFFLQCLFQLFIFSGIRYAVPIVLLGLSSQVYPCSDFPIIGRHSFLWSLCIPGTWYSKGNPFPSPWKELQWNQFFPVSVLCICPAIFYQKWR